MTMVLVIALVMLTVAAVYVALRSRGKRAAGQPLQPLDIQAFRALTDREDEQFLREKLARSQFFKLKRKRIQVTFRYLGRISSNAGVVLRLGQSAQRSQNPEAQQAAAHVVDLATSVRLQCMVGMAKLGFEYAFPSMQLRPAMLANRYQELRENVVLLGSLQPQRMGTVASSI